MRTTLSLDDDVAALLQRALTRRKEPLKKVVNDALREGSRDSWGRGPLGRPITPGP